MLPIKNIAEKLSLTQDQIIPYGNDIAKIKPDLLSQDQNGKLILVTAISPTPSGEGKTTISTGLADALNHKGESVVLALREPSMGPCFGFKGGATGGGKASLHPAVDINLHFTGDFHAITSANNLLAALIDNHLYRKNRLQLNTNQIFWKRVLDLNDRALREVVVGMGSKNGVTRESAFEITPASEIMAILCLAKDKADLTRRLSQIELGLNLEKKSVRANDIEAVDMLGLILKDALKPNLVQTLEETPTLVHGGPFANIAHGCNSVVATQSALKLADFVVTEAGFGADLGAEKFFNIKCRQSGVKPSAVVVVATLKALKFHGGVSAKLVNEPNPSALESGLSNLKRHCQNMSKFGYKPVVAINQFEHDTAEEIKVLADFCGSQGYEYALCEVFTKGGQGALDLAEKVKNACLQKNDFKLTYPDEMPLLEKGETVAKEIYQAKTLNWDSRAKRQLKRIESLGLGNLPICMAKTQYSFSDDPNKRGAPQGFEFSVRDAKLSAGAEFVVLYAGDIMTMPGLPKTPMAKIPKE